MKLDHFYRDKVVLITGASQGIGKELARQVLDLGGKVILTGRKEAKLIQVKEEFQESTSNISLHVGDVADFLNAKDLIKKVIQEQGKLDVLINNAGLAGHGEVGELAPAAVNQIIDTNVKGVIYQTRAALPELIKSSGSVLFVSSIAGLWGFPAYSLYSLSKMALTAFAETLRIENTYRGLFVGISYVCFTENEPDKQWLNPAGGLESLPGRNKLFLATREKTARIMLRQIARKKYRVVHSLLGKLTYFMTRFFPGIVDWVFREYYRSRKKGDPV